MRHGMVNRKLGRKSAHRAAMFRNQLASLIENERIITTLPKAKELRPQIERLVTLGREDSVHNRRQAFRSVADDTLIAKLFDTISPRFTDRPGGYTRIIKLGPRRGDAAEMAILEFVTYELGAGDDKKEAPAAAGKKAAPAKKAKPAEKAEPAAEEEKPKRASKKAAPKADEGEKPKKAAAKKPAAAKKKKEE